MTYSTKQVSELTGLTLRQLQWLDERGVVRPSREGRLRSYSREQVSEIQQIREIRHDYRISFARLLPLMEKHRKIRIISQPTVIGRSLVIPCLRQRA